MVTLLKQMMITAVLVVTIYLPTDTHFLKKKSLLILLHLTTNTHFLFIRVGIKYTQNFCFYIKFGQAFF